MHSWKVQRNLKWCHKYFLLRSNTQLGSGLISLPVVWGRRVSFSRSKTASCTEDSLMPWVLRVEPRFCVNLLGGEGRAGEGMRKVIPALREIQYCLPARSECLGHPDAALNLIPFSLIRRRLRLPLGPEAGTWPCPGHRSCHQEIYSSPAGT